MSVIEFDVDVDLAGIQGVRERASNLRPAWHAVADVARDELRLVFARGGPGWPGPTLRYAAYKRRRRPGRPQGVWDGVLRASLTRRGARYSRQHITAHSVSVLSSDPAGRLFTRGRGGQRARPVHVDRRRFSSRARDELQHYLLSDRAFTGII